MENSIHDQQLSAADPVLPIFVQLNVRLESKQDSKWREASRWVKFQEDVESGGKRWSKPFVPALPFRAITELKRCFVEGIVALDVHGTNIHDILDEVHDLRKINRDEVNVEIPLLDSPEKFESLKALLSFNTKLRVKSKLLVKVSTVVSMHHALQSHDSSSSIKNLTGPNGAAKGPNAGDSDLCHSATDPSGRFAMVGEALAKKSQEHNPFVKKIPRGSESCLVLAASVDFVTHPSLIFLRLKEPCVFTNLCEMTAVKTRFLGIIVGPSTAETPLIDIGKALGTLMSDQIFPLLAYRATNKQQLVDGVESYTSEVIVLAPSAWDPNSRLEPPETIPTVTKRVLNRTQHSNHTLPSTQSSLQDENDGGSSEKAKLFRSSSSLDDPVNNKDLYWELEQGRVDENAASSADADKLGNRDNDDSLRMTGKLFGGLIADVKRKSKWFLSDFTDALHMQTLASIIYIYLATITKAITFGGFLGDITEGRQGVLEAFLGHALAGGVFCLFGGQPLTVLGCTGPVLIFEKILVDFCEASDLDYMTMRLYIGLWSCLFCILIVAFDLSSFVRYFTRFTEESFAALVGIIFIVESLKKLYKMSMQYKVHEGFHLSHVAFIEETCHCVPASDPSTYFQNASTDHLREFLEVKARTNGSMNSFEDIPWDHLTLDECKMFGGSLAGEWCNYVPDIFFFSVTLFFGTFIMSSSLKKFKLTPFFPAFIRGLISDYAVIISILIFVAIDHHFNLETPKLIVPTEFKPTRSDIRTWVIPFTQESTQWYTYLGAAIPAMLLTILLFMDQQITSVIVNRKEHKLRKGAGYHLDMLIVGVMMGVSSILGLPWCVAATVLCLGHVDSLKMETETSAPGEKPTFLGVREQRVTGTMVFILTGVSVKLAPILKYIPMPVLYGVLMYMGVASLKGMQFIDRLGLLMMPPKYQPDYYYLRHVPISKVHFFTIIQILALGLLWLLKSTKASLIFPLMVLALVGFRKCMDYTPRIFSQNDLYWLDNLMPSSGSDKKKEEGKDKSKKRRFFSVGRWKVENEMALPSKSDLKAQAPLMVDNNACENGEKPFQ